MIRAELHATIAILRMIEIREHDHQGRRLVLFDGFEDLDAAAAGHRNVQHDDIRTFGLDARDGVARHFRFPGNGHVRHFGEQRNQALPHDRRIIDDKYLC